jgi:hypothetical protein
MNKEKSASEMNIVERCCAPTPKFFKKLRTVGLILAAAGGAIIAAPVALPVALVTAAGYVIVAGSVATAVSQVAVEECGPFKKK